MTYEAAWLNGSIPCSVSEVGSIANVYLAAGQTDDLSENCILATAVREVGTVCREMFGIQPEVWQYLTIAQVYDKSSYNANAAGGRHSGAGREFDICLVYDREDTPGDCDAEDRNAEECSTEDCSTDDCSTDDSSAEDRNAEDRNAESYSTGYRHAGTYRISTDAQRGLITVSAGDAHGILYGVFRLIFKLRTCTQVAELAEEQMPASPLRMLNHWDNMDGSIERGYAGRSFFFKDDRVLVDDRTRAYARMVASVGINAAVINNVNVKSAATELITARYRQEIKQLAAIFAEYGIRLFLSLNFAAPIELGGLDNCDPADAGVRAWWKQTLDELFQDVPQLGGFLIKADSEGRPGPFTYGRNHAEGANMLADIVAGYGALIIWRCFVYNCRQDWRDTVTDRARAQYDNFIGLDGLFRDNVILQIKNGPMDFQPREPVSPLFGGLKHTNEIIEFQIAQEYTGQQKHVCYLIPWFKQILDFRTYIDTANDDRVRDIVTGRTFGNSHCGMTAVANTGDDPNWTGHDLAAANLYGFGRLSFNPDLSAEEIAGEWIKLTFGHDEVLFHKISDILMSSWPAYESYSSPLGVGWMVNPNHHYGPNVDGYEFSEWGTYHRSDSLGMGVERGESGTGFIAQYNEPNRSMYEDKETCPDELLLFMHHVPYTYRLHSGKTVIQHIYDSHFEGADEAVRLRELWRSLEGHIDDDIYIRTLDRFDEQVRSAGEWRDAVCTYYRAKSGIPDEKGRL